MIRRIVVIVLAACGTSPEVAAPHVESSPIRIERHADAVRAASSVQTVALPFGQNQNGSLLVLALLDRARASGAAAVADLAFHLVFKWHGQYVECETHVAFADDPALAAPAAPAAPAAAANESDADYSTEVAGFAPRTAIVKTTEDDLHCESVPVKVIEYQPRTASRFDAEVARKSDAIPTEQVIHVVRQDACGLAPVTREARRFDFQLKLGYVPPDWKYLAARFANGPLVETAPICFAIDPAQLPAHPTHVMTATVAYPGTVARHEPLRAPSAEPDDRQPPPVMRHRPQP